MACVLGRQQICPGLAQELHAGSWRRPWDGVCPAQFTVGTWFWWRLNSLALRRRLAMLLAMLTPWVGVAVPLEL